MRRRSRRGNGMDRNKGQAPVKQTAPVQDHGLVCASRSHLTVQQDHGLLERQGVPDLHLAEGALQDTCGKKEHEGSR